MLNQRLFNMAKIKFGRINQIYLVCCYYCSNQNNTSPKCVHLNIFIWDFMAFSIQNIQNCQESINWYFFLLKAIKSFFVNKLAISPSGYSGRNSYLFNFLGLFFGYSATIMFYNPHADILSLYLKNNIMLFPCQLLLV